jgi:hypothetical protein
MWDHASTCAQQGEGAQGEAGAGQFEGWWVAARCGNYSDFLLFLAAQAVLQYDRAAAVFHLARNTFLKQHAAEESVAPSEDKFWREKSIPKQINAFSSGRSTGTYLSRFCSSQ